MEQAPLIKESTSIPPLPKDFVLENKNQPKNIAESVKEFNFEKLVPPLAFLVFLIITLLTGLGIRWAIHGLR